MGIYIRLLGACLTFSTVSVFADNSILSADYINKQQALSCIQLNKDMNLASQQMLLTEPNTAHLKSKISYLSEELATRRNIIEQLDRRYTTENNDNYNSLVSQFEDLRDEYNETIELYNIEQQKYVSQHESVIRLEQRFSTECLQQISITQDLFNEVCQFEDIRWCTLFNFDS